MKFCKNCIQFLETEHGYRCLELATACTPCKNPNLGQELRGCKYEPKPKKKSAEKAPTEE